MRLNPAAPLVVVFLVASAAAIASPLPVLVCLGDSVTLGPDPSYPQMLLEDFAGQLLVMNAGVTGEMAGSGVPRLKRILHALNGEAPVIVVVMYGINDARLINSAVSEATVVGIDAFKDQLRAIVADVEREGGKVVLVTPTPLGPNWTGAGRGYYGTRGVNYYLDTFAEAVRSIAAETKAPLVDMNRVAKSTPGWIEALSDGVHPPPAGARLIADKVSKVIAPFVNPRRTRAIKR